MFSFVSLYSLGMVSKMLIGLKYAQIFKNLFLVKVVNNQFDPNPKNFGQKQLSQPIFNLVPIRKLTITTFFLRSLSTI